MLKDIISVIIMVCLFYLITVMLMSFWGVKVKNLDTGYYLKIDSNTYNKISNIRDYYENGLIPELEFYDKFIDAIVKEFYGQKMPEIIYIYNKV